MRHIDREIASVLNRLLERAELSQNAFADLAGVSQSYISQICSGKRIPTIDMLRRFSERLGVPVKVFFETEEEGRPALTAEEERFLALYRTLDPGLRRAVYRLTEQLGEEKTSAGCQQHGA